MVTDNNINGSAEVAKGAHSYTRLQWLRIIGEHDWFGIHGRLKYALWIGPAFKQAPGTVHLYPPGSLKKP